MADFLLRDIDEKVANRIKAIAREKGWPLGDVFMHLIKVALGMAEPEPPPVPGDIARLNGAFKDEESKALEAAMRAFSDMPDDVPHYEMEQRLGPNDRRSR